MSDSQIKTKLEEEWVKQSVAIEKETVKPPLWFSKANKQNLNLLLNDETTSDLKKRLNTLEVVLKKWNIKENKNGFEIISLFKVEFYMFMSYLIESRKPFTLGEAEDFIVV